MPRPRTETIEEISVDAPKKRAPRKRVPKTEDGEVVSRTRAPRKRVPDAPEMVATAPRESLRRAPTPLRAEATMAKKGQRALLIVVIITLCIIGAGVGIGMSDRGEIDVVAVVNARNERINRGEVREGESTITIPVQNTDIRPNGGMVPIDPSTLPPTTESAVPTTESMASSTDSMSSTSTEPVTPDEAASSTPAETEATGV